MFIFDGTTKKWVYNLREITILTAICSRYNCKYPKSNRIVLNKRFPVSVPPFPVNLFFDNLSATIFNLSPSL